MTDNVQPIRDNQQIRCMGLKSVGDQKKQGTLANKQQKQKLRKKKQGQEMNDQDNLPQADENTTPFVGDGKDKDELPKNGCGSILDLEI